MGFGNKGGPPLPPPPPPDLVGTFPPLPPPRPPPPRPPPPPPPPARQYVSELFPGFPHRRRQLRRHPPHDLPRAGVGHPADHRHPPLDDPRLLVRDLLGRVAELGRVVEPDVRDDRHQRP